MENPERSQVTGTLKVSPSYFHTSLNTEHIHNLSRILIRTEGWRGAGLPPARLLQGQISLSLGLGRWSDIIYKEKNISTLITLKIEGLVWLDDVREWTPLRYCYYWQ